MRYNKKNFKKFLNENCKTKNYDFDAYREDLENQHGCTGSREYELSHFESKDGLPHLFQY